MSLSRLLPFSVVLLNVDGEVGSSLYVPTEYKVTTLYQYIGAIYVAFRLYKGIDPSVKDLPLYLKPPVVRQKRMENRNVNFVKFLYTIEKRLITNF